MLTQDQVASLIQNETEENARTISPATMQTPLGGMMQGFIADTPNTLCFVFENEAGEPSVMEFERDAIQVGKTEMGVMGKTYNLVIEGEVYKFGGMVTVFERILEKEFSKGDAPQSPPQTSFSELVQPQTLDEIKNFRPPEQAYKSPQGSYATGSGSGKSPALAVTIAIVLLGALVSVGFFIVKDMVMKKSVEPQNASQPGTVESTTVAQIPSGSDIILMDANGSALFSVQKKESGKYKIIAGANEWKAKFDADRVKVKTDSDQDLIKVKVKDYGFKVDGPNDATIIKGKLSGAGYKVKTDDTELGKVMPKGEGYEAYDASGSLLAVVTVEDGSAIVKDASGNLLYTVKGAFPKAAAFLPYLKDKLDAQAGVLIYFNETR